MHPNSPKMSRKTSRSWRRSIGFTLIELLVVLAILTLLASLVGPRVLGQLGGAKSKTAALQFDQRKADVAPQD